MSDVRAIVWLHARGASGATAAVPFASCPCLPLNHYDLALCRFASALTFISSTGRSPDIVDAGYRKCVGALASVLFTNSSTTDALPGDRAEQRM